MSARRRFTTSERRARLVARHHLAGDATSAEQATRALVAVHSSDPITPHLALRARVRDFVVRDLEDALYERRSLWRLHAMRRTLFVVPADQGGVFAAACAADIAVRERRRLEQWLHDAEPAPDPAGWLASVERDTLAVLADGVPRRVQELSAQVEGLRLQLTVGSGRWTTQVSLASRLLFVLALEGRVVRTRPAGSWISSQYLWAATERWFPEPVEPVDPATARAALARAWLAAHGPATAQDLQWWTGWTVRHTRAALEAVGAVAVDLPDATGDHSATGFVLPDDVDTPVPEHHSVAFLPGLDPTIMGWKERDWYLGEHGSRLFDSAGNAGPSIWVDGRVVGGWGLRGTDVVTSVLDDVGAEMRAEIDAEAHALTQWLGGTAPTPRFRTPLERSLARG